MPRYLFVPEAGIAAAYSDRPVLPGPGPMICVWTPQSRVLDTYPIPVGVSGPTNCCFVDADQINLYVPTGQGHLLWPRNTGCRGWIMWPRCGILPHD